MPILAEYLFTEGTMKDLMCMIYKDTVICDKLTMMKKDYQIIYNKGKQEEIIPRLLKTIFTRVMVKEIR